MKQQTSKALLLLATLLLTLTGCIGEDYDVGVPEAELYTDGLAVHTELTLANVNWSSSSDGDVNIGVKDLNDHAKDLPTVHFKTNQQAFIDYRMNKKNGGDLRDFPVITLYLLTPDKERIPLNITDTGDLIIPNRVGKYTIVYELGSDHGFAQYVGNIEIVK